MYGMTFNGVKKDYVVTLRGKRRPPWAPLKRNLLEVPGKVGAYLESTNVESRPLDVPILIETNSLSELQNVKEDLAEWLVTDEPKELIFDDEPDRTYYAMVDGTLDIDELIRVGLGIVKFICPDPYKYGPEEKLTPNAIDLTQPLILDVSGTEETPPIFDITLKELTTYLDIVNDNDYMRLGRPVSEEQYAAPAETQVLYDGMTSLTGWTYHDGFELDWSENTSSGTMDIIDGEMRIDNAGTGVGWHGPAVIKTLDEPLTDFDMVLNMRIDNPNWGNMGRMEMYLLDEFYNVAGKLSLRHRTMARDGNHVELRAGDVTDGRYIVQERGDHWNTWLNFSGRLQLSRVGNLWTAYVAKYDENDEHVARRHRTWVDLETKYTRKVAHILLHMGQYGDNPISSMGINAFRLNKVNSLSGQEIPYIGEPGDIFTIDMKRNLILKNREPYMKKDFGSRFFNLKPGSNGLIIDPASAIDNVGVNWRARYK
jgi:predicted phage tail component-like protein